jgi:mono/diheme cytochrome c family protein
MKSFSIWIVVASLSFIAGAGLTYVAKTPWTSDMANQPSIKPQEGPMLPPQGSVATDVISGTGAAAGNMSESEAGHQDMGHQGAMGEAAGHQHDGASAKQDHASKGSSKAMGQELGTSAAGDHQHGGTAAKHDHPAKGSSPAMGQQQHGASAAGGHQHDGAAAEPDYASKGVFPAKGQKQGTSAGGGHQHDGAAAKNDQGPKSTAPSQTKDSQHATAGEAQQTSDTTFHRLPYDLLGSAGTGPGTTTGTSRTSDPTSGDQSKATGGMQEHGSKTMPPAKTKDSHDNHSTNSASPSGSASHEHRPSASSGQKASKMAAHDHGGNPATSSAGKAKHSHSSGTSDKMKPAASKEMNQHGHGAGAGNGPAHGGMQSQGQITNPIKPTEASVKKGQKLFNVYCSVCHGTEGRGGKPMAGKLAGIPTFTPELLRKVDDNHMFSMVTSGHGPMPGYAEALTPEERWHVTNYVRTLPEKLAEKGPARKGASR